MHGMLHRNTDAICRVEESSFRFAHGSRSCVNIRVKGVSSVFIGSDFVLHRLKWMFIKMAHCSGVWDAFFMMTIVADHGSVDFQMRSAICLGFLGLPHAWVVADTAVEFIHQSGGGGIF